MRIAILKSEVDDNFTKGECYSCPFSIETYTDDYEDDYDFHIRCPVMAKRFALRYEFVFWFVKDKNNYTFNLDDVKIPALNYRPDRYKSQLKNPTDVWRMSMVSGNFEERTAHPAQYPEQLIERIILTGSNPGDIIMNPFMGSGTTAVVAKKLGRHFLGYEIERDYCSMAEERLTKVEEENGI